YHFEALVVGLRLGRRFGVAFAGPLPIWFDLTPGQSVTV
ncbi:unnamed protein product, partial [marine sediment metagenome]